MSKSSKTGLTPFAEIKGSREEFTRCSEEVFAHWHNLRTLARLLEHHESHPAGRQVQDTGLMMGTELDKMYGWLLRWVEVVRLTQDGK